MQEIFFSIVIFSAILLLLAALILWVRSQLVPQGDIKITVNEEVDAGLRPHQTGRKASPGWRRSAKSAVARTKLPASQNGVP